MFDYILHALQAFWTWFLDVVWGFGDRALGWVISLIPTSADAGLGSGWNAIRFGIDAGNQWVPITEAISLASVFVAFVTSFLLIKILIKLIP